MGWNVGCVIFFSLFYMNLGCCFFGKRKRKKCPIVDENVRSMTQEAKPALAFNCFTVTECVPGNPSVAVKQMWIFMFWGK